MSISLQAENVCAAYGKGAARVEVLKGFSLTLRAGEFVALMGPSGSGKSTFLHLAAGLLLPESGTIAVGGQDVTAMGDAAATRVCFRRDGRIAADFATGHDPAAISARYLETYE